MRWHLWLAAVALSLVTTLLLWGQVADLPLSPASMDWSVLVVDDETGEPVPCAKVWTVTGGSASSIHLYPGYFGHDNQEFLRRHQTSAFTDDRGFARLPGQSGMSASAIAEHDGKIGNAWTSFCGTGRIGPPPQPEARLSYLAQQKVLVLNVDGQPVEGAQIGVDLDRDFDGRCLLAITNEKGMATLQLSLQIRQMLERDIASLYVQSLGFESVRAILDSPPQDVVVLQLPKSKRLEIEFLNPDGSRCADTIDFHISDLDTRHWGRFFAGTTSGRFSIPAIGFGDRYYLRAETWDRNKTGWADTFAISEDHDGVVPLKVQMKWTSFLIQGRCLLPNGKPLSNANLTVEWDTFDPEDPGARSFHERFTLKTSSSGHFYGPNGDALYFSDPWRNLEISTVLDGGRYRLSLPEYSTTEKGPLNLGEITLQK